MFSEGVIGDSNIEALEVWSLSECWPAQGNADVLKIRQKNLPDNFSRLLTPGPSLSVSHGNLPQRYVVLCRLCL